jgi:ADP-heptose:LPS heptosyltransferase
LNLKRLERAWKAASIHAIISVFRLQDRLRGSSRARSPARDWDSRPHRVLVLRYDRIGDMILTTGIIGALADAHPGILIDVVASRSNASVLREERRVRNIFVLEKRKWWTFGRLARRLRRERYDAVLDCMVSTRSLTTLLWMLASGARDRIGVAGRGIDEALTLPVARRPGHMVDQLGALTTPFGIDPSTADLRPRLVLADTEMAAAEAVWDAAAGGARGIRLFDNISVALAYRDWPDDRFVAVIKHVRERPAALTILVHGAPDQHSRVERIASEGGAVAVAPCPIREALALVATSDVVFTPDTSFVHAASAFLRPAVVMYGGGAEREWGLYHSPGQMLPSPERVVSSLPVGPVRQALDELIDQAIANATSGARATSTVAPR